MEDMNVINLESFFEKLPRLDQKFRGNIYYRG